MDLMPAARRPYDATNQFTFGAIFQRATRATGDVPGGRRQAADIIPSWPKAETVC